MAKISIQRLQAGEDAGKREASGTKYDLEERTAAFGEKIIEFASSIGRSPISAPLVSQLIRSATSIGANYAEADEAESKKDFRHKIALCRKEARETRYWLRMIGKADAASVERARILWREAKELNLIFAAIVRTSLNREEQQNKREGV